MLKSKLDVITIGDTTIDTFMFIDDDTGGITLRGHTLGLDYGSKIPIRSIHRVVGAGNSANIAIGVARLGLRTAVYTHVGCDTDGAEMVRQFSREGVLTKFIVRDREKKTNMSAVINYGSDRTILVFHDDRSYVLPQRLPESRYIYFSSIHGNHMSFNFELARYIERTGTKLVFNPGTMQMELGAKKLAPILEVSDIIFVNKDEARKLLGLNTKNDQALLLGLRELGPVNVVMTDGANGASALFADVLYTIPAPDGRIVERTGCGDAFASGFLSTYVRHGEVDNALRWGSMNAISVAQCVGSVAGLLRHNEMSDKLLINPDFYPVRRNL
jgi:sugar/nucleoside kinase (ribokinase family)